MGSSRLNAKGAVFVAVVAAACFVDLSFVTAQSATQCDSSSYTDRRSEHMLIHDIIVDSTSDSVTPLHCDYGVCTPQLIGCSTPLAKASPGSICTLRAAIEHINADVNHPGTWVIQLPAGNIELTRPLPPIVSHTVAAFCGFKPHDQDIDFAGTSCDPDFTGDEPEPSDIKRATAKVFTSISGENPYDQVCGLRVLQSCVYSSMHRVSSIPNRRDH